MSNSTTNLDLISATQAAKETSANALFDAGSPAVIWGRRASSTAGLTWGYYGGNYQVGTTSNAIANGTVTLTASTTNYVYADNATGAVSVNTTGVPTGKIPLYTVVTGVSGVASYTDLRSYQPAALGGGGGGSGTVTSVGLSAPAQFTVTNSPVTSSGTIALTWAAQAANLVFAGPTSGAAATPGFRALVAADIPVFVASGASHAAGAVPDPGATAGTTRFLREDSTWAVPAGGGGGSTALSGLSDVSVPAMNSTTVGPVDTTNYSSSTYAWKGNLLTASQNCYVTSITAHFNAVSGVPLQAAIATAASGTLTSAPVFSNQVTPGSSGSIDITFTFSTPVALTSGTQYAFVVGAPTQGNAWPLPADVTTASWPTSSFVTMGTVCRLQVNPLANGSAYDTNGGSALPVTMRVAFTTVNIAGQYLRNNGTAWTNSAIQAADVPVFAASGSSHAPGGVPDPGATSGTTRFLREDSTWAVPTASAKDAHGYYLANNPTTTGFTLSQSTSLSGNASMNNLGSARGFNIIVPCQSASDNNAFVNKAAPGGSSWTMTALLTPMVPPGNASNFSLAVKDSAGKIVLFGFDGFANKVAYGKWSDINTFVGRTGYSAFPLPPGVPVWMKLSYTSGGNFVFSLSSDGETFAQMFAISVTDYISTPSACGIWVDHNLGSSSSTTQIAVSVMSYTQG
ncbi:hypothetical protein [Burkholderia cenocepacia]|uniref:hypothetical protein n=1 Tax=Burkholderia cenocepacia TaxID=95486 RepID=UPI00264C82E2|nr:hypothetical protein [Burkholderia cenocepacia]MDN7456605.1 hypothetical protein [Burkholderia cenocepacia]